MGCSIPNVKPGQVHPDPLAAGQVHSDLLAAGQVHPDLLAAHNLASTTEFGGVG